MEELAKRVLSVESGFEFMDGGTRLQVILMSERTLFQTLRNSQAKRLSAWG